MTERQSQIVAKLLDLLNHRTGGAAVGAAGGALVGALLNDHGKKRRMRRAAVGGLLGAGLGYGAARAFPVQSQAVNDTLVRDLISKPVGRVVTNLLPPAHYNDKLNELKDAIVNEPGKVLGHVIDDTPLDDPKGSSTASNWVRTREVPYRMMFGLKPRSWGEPHTVNPDSTLSLSAQGAEELRSDVENQSYVQNPRHFYHSTLGNVVVAPAPGAKTHYHDRWDFDLGGDGKPHSWPDVLRALTGKITRPVTFDGNVNAELRERVVPDWEKDAAINTRWQELFT